jgi:two-component system CheB/CheR fusion protein
VGIGASAGGLEALEDFFDNMPPETGLAFVVIQHLSPDLRKMIVFAPHNIIKDAPFTRLDMISCRNLLIYLQPLAQKKALSLFHFGLKSGGYLFLGSSESPGELSDEFAPVDSHWRIYRKRRDVRLAPDLRLPLSTGYSLPRSRSVTPAGPAHGGIDMPLLQAYDTLLDAHVPPSLLINEQRELIQCFAGAGKYVQPPDGRQSRDVLDCLDKDVRVAVAGALQRAAKSLSPVVYAGLPVPAEGCEEELKVTVTPLADRDSGATYFLITLESLQRPSAVSRPPAAPAPVGLPEASRERIQALESDLRYTRENLQATIEEMETTNEELQATNQELVASNEELQSTNEELHSVNEELYTVNAEHQRKIRELTVLTDDMNNLFRSTDVGTIFLDRELCIRKFTPKIGETFQILPQDIGRRIDGFSHNLIHEGLFDDIHHVLRTETKLEREVRDRHGNWFLLRALPYRSEAGVDGVIVSLIDFSALKQTESQLRLMSKVFHDGVYPKLIEDLSGCIMDVNEEAVRVLGFAREELIGREARLLVPEPQRGQITTLRRRCRRAERVRDFETVFLRKSGKVLPVSLTMSLLHDESDAPVAIAWMMKDIARQKRAEEDRARYAAQLEATNEQLRENVEKRIAAEAVAVEQARRREEFLAMLSHELRNPLAALLNGTHVLDRMLPDDAGKEPLDVIQRQARQMARLMDDLLDVSRVAQGKIEIRREVVDLAALVDDVLAAVRPVFEERGHELAVEVAGKPLCVVGDPARLRQVIENLLVNAAKYTPTSGHVALSMGRDGDTAEIQVRDDGIGISADMLDHIFELFVQSDSTADGSGGGMGVGLTLVRHLVQLQGGTVTASSEGTHQGSVFVVRLPLTHKHPEPAPSTPPAPAKAASTKIVLVEDNADARGMLKSLLELDGYQVVAAENGRQGVESILREKPDVALVDIGLPELDGYGVAREVRGSSADHDVYLVALTGYGQQKDRIAVLEAGFDEHLVKPMNMDELTRVLTLPRKPR